MATVTGNSADSGVPGVLGESTQWNGVLGVSTANGHSGVAGVHDEGVGNGVYGRSKGGDGVQGYTSADGHAGVAGVGQSPNSNGVYGRAEGAGAGVRGESAQWNGVLGVSKADGHSGVAGVHDEGNGFGVFGRSTNNAGVVGTSTKQAGVYGESNEYNGVLGISKANGHSGVAGANDEGNGYGVFGRSKNGEGVHGETQSASTAAMAAYNLNPNGTGAAIFAKKEGSQGHAGFFDGNVWISGELAVGKDIILANADCAEDFDVSGADKVEPGTVMVLGNEGDLSESQQAYDKRVAGVISGAGDYKPGIVLDKRQTSGNRQPIALLGKVFCKVDAQFGAIEVGDLLTTSPTRGHAMRVDDPFKALGTIIGKALRPLQAGQGLIPILIALQ